MKIKIAQPLHPFCHRPGTCCVLPKSAWKVEIFPCLLRFTQDHSSEKQEVVLHLKGPIKDFTVMQDLEKAHLQVFGVSQEGYFRYVLSQEEEGIILHFEKATASGVSVEEKSSCKTKLVKNKEEIALSFGKKEKPIAVSLEKLSLGLHKSQDWEMVQRRKDFAEIFPIWLRLGQLLPLSQEPKHKKGTLKLLEDCQRVIAEHKRTEVLPSFLNLFLAGFSGILSPRSHDDDHLGILPEEEFSDEGSLLLLTKGSSLIRSLFFQENENTFSFLPCLPPEFHAGRFVQIQTTDGDLIDLEWSKKLLRRAVIRIKTKKTIHLALQKDHKAFRLRRSLKEKGKTFSKDEPIPCKDHDVLLLDRFQK